MTNHEVFLQAIKEKRMINLKFNSFEKGTITRKCIPFDYGPSRAMKEKANKYHFKDLDSPDGPHILSIFPNQLVGIELLDETFKPGDHINWHPRWFVERDWGEFS